MTILITLGVLVFLSHAGICAYIIGLIVKAMCEEHMGTWSNAVSVFVCTSLMLSVVLDAIGMYTLITI